MTEREHAMHVKEVRRAAKAQEGAQWEMGKHAAAYSDKEEGGAGNIGSLRRLAQDAGVEYSTLKNYRRVFLEFPEPDRRRAGLGFESHKELTWVPEEKRDFVFEEALELTRERRPDAEVPSKRDIQEAAKPYKPKPSRKRIEATATAQAAIDLYEACELLNKVLEGLPDIRVEGEPLRDMLATLDTITSAVGAIGSGLMASDSIEQGLGELTRNG